MCALFSISDSEAVFTCQLLGRLSSIEPVLENCSYIGFIIQLHSFEFERYRKLNEAVAAFVHVIEMRIDEQDFTSLYIHPASSELNASGVPRVVFDPRGRVLHTWSRP